MKPWEDSEIALLGTMSDAEVAEKTNRTKASVLSKRTSLKINNLNDGRGRWWREQSFTDYEISLLGKMTDKELAEKLGKPYPTIRSKRMSMGIPNYSNIARKKFTNGEISLMGTMPDQELARRLGRSYLTIYVKRKRLGIARFSPLNNINLNWAKLSKLPQAEFFNIIQKELSKKLKKKSAYPDIAKLTFYSVSRIQKWATAGTAQQPLSMATRHHIYLAVQFKIIS